MDVSIRYLYHSGFSVDTGAHYLIFDYWRDTPKGGGLEEGVIDPAALRDKDVLVFASHRHGDHYNPVIFDWAKQVPEIRYILSDDIPKHPGALMVGKNKSYTGEGFSLKTFASTDEGVAFLLEIDGLRIYHAGDLNWWHWAGETDAYNQDMEKDYKKQVALMGTKAIDLAFVPVDPRLEEQYSWGLHHLMDSIPVDWAVPMHFGESTSVVDRLLADPVSGSYRDRIIPLAKRGQLETISCL